MKWKEVKLESSSWLLQCRDLAKKYKSGNEKLTLNLVDTHDRLYLVLIEMLVSKERMVIPQESR